jgi:DNA-3-methyladenine glycosylase II
MRRRTTELRRARAHLVRADPVLAEIVKKVGPCRLTLHRGGDAYWYLSRAILRQQISGYAAAAIERRIRERFDGTLKPEHVLGASDAELRGLGLSRQKAGYLRDSRRAPRDGLRLPSSRPHAGRAHDRDAHGREGDRPLDVEMLLIFRFRAAGRAAGRRLRDPEGDAARLRHAQAARSPSAMRKIAETWRPYRSIACWYLWRSLDLKTP